MHDKKMFRVYIKMVLSSSKRTSSISSISNQSQGGGNKKAGFPGTVGRSAWMSIHLNTVNPAQGHCKSFFSLLLPFPDPLATTPTDPTGNTLKGIYTLYSFHNKYNDLRYAACIKSLIS
jgi:hypothetical protein